MEQSNKTDKTNKTKQMKKETTKAWIARDENGGLCIYEIKPTKKNTYYGRGGYWFPLKQSLFPDLTFENSPKECEIAITIK